MRKAIVMWLALLLVVPLTGCAKAAEKVAEKTIENASGGDANVDLSNNGGTVKIETSEGSATYGGGEIPGSIDITFPSGGTVLVSTDSATEASVMVQYEGANFDDIVASFQNWVDDSGDEYEPMSVTAGGVQSQTWASESTTIGVQTCSSESGEMDAVCVYVTVEKS
ncbi:MAG: hypothetical protein WAM81_02180 [Acidimicrobiia bacterium]